MFGRCERDGSAWGWRAVGKLHAAGNGVPSFVSRRFYLKIV